MEQDFNTGQNGPVIQPANTQQPAPRENITAWGKFLAGFLLITLTLLSGLYIVSHWPDKLPRPGDGVVPLYSYGFFDVKLAGITEKEVIVTPLPDTTLTTAAAENAKPIDTINAVKPADTTRPQPTVAKVIAKVKTKYNAVVDTHNLMHINSILLILVAMGGFMGSMIHVSTSFTTFVGEGSFRRSWLIWYCVKPFTAAALALTIYFVFRGGFLNMSDDVVNINLYGVMTMAILSGLFTDRATLKLKEVFDVLLRPKEERSDPLKTDKPVITGVTAELPEGGKTASLTVAGKYLDKGQIEIVIDGKAVTNSIITAEKISFTYELPDDHSAEEITIIIKTDKETLPKEYKLKINKK